MKSIGARILPFVRRPIQYLGAWIRRSFLRATHGGRGASAVEPAEWIGTDLIQSEESTIPDAAIETLVAAPAPTRKARRKAEDANEDDSTRWHFRGAILDRLDEYFVCIKRLKKHDPDAYALFSRIGLAIPADRFWSVTPLDAIERFRGCSFGGVMMSCEETDGDTVVPSFFYFMKVKHAPRVAIPRDRSADVYQVTLLYDARRGVRWESDLTQPATFYAALSANGETQLLPELVRTSEPFKSGRMRQPIWFSRTSWRTPSWIDSTVLDRRERKPSAEPETPHEFAANILATAIATYGSSLEKIVIKANRGTESASFGVDVARCKYFFSDRDVDALAADGKRKRIFHFVRRHDRKLSGDRSSSVREHYRGIRNFSWNGTQIHIVLPDRKDVLYYDKPGEIRESDDDRSGMIGTDEVGRRFEEVLAQ